MVAAGQAQLLTGRYLRPACCALGCVHSGFFAAFFWAFFRLDAGRFAAWPFHRALAAAVAAAFRSSGVRLFAVAVPPARPISSTSMIRVSLIFFPIFSPSIQQLRSGGEQVKISVDMRSNGAHTIYMSMDRDPFPLTAPDRADPCAVRELWDGGQPTTGADLPSVPQGTIRLPNTCPENRRFFTHFRILTAVNPNAWNGAGFDGALFEAGARISAEEIRKHPIVIESAGPQGTWKHKRNRENLYLLWRYDWEVGGWKEIARATATNWSWAVVLRGPAISALEPRREADPHDRAGIVLEGILGAIDSALSPELPAVQALVLCALYERVAGRLARLD